MFPYSSRTQAWTANCIVCWSHSRDVELGAVVVDGPDVPPPDPVKDSKRWI